MKRNIDLLLSGEESLVASMARDFANSEVAKLSKQTDAEHRFPEELIPKLSNLGFMGVQVSDEYGGSELESTSYAIIMEELSRACASTGTIVGAHNSLGIAPIDKFGSDEQKAKYLPKMTSGEHMGCFALSEPSTGSDAARLICMAKKSDKGWVVNGSKNWITNAPVADICILFAMTDSSLKHKGINTFIVDMKSDGISVGEKENKLGICGSPTASITFEDVLIPFENQIGKDGEGFTHAMKTLDAGRIGIAAQAVGIAQAALDDSVKYSKEREAFGKPISRHQSIQNYLADMSIQIDAARLLTYQAALRKDKGLDFSKEAAQAKLFASEMSVQVALNAIQIHGGYGYVKDFKVERYLRDSKITQIYEGTSEIQRLVIARHLLED